MECLLNGLYEIIIEEKEDCSSRKVNNLLKNYPWIKFKTPDECFQSYLKRRPKNQTTVNNDIVQKWCFIIQAFNQSRINISYNDLLLLVFKKMLLSTYDLEFLYVSIILHYEYKFEKSFKILCRQSEDFEKYIISLNLPMHKWFLLFKYHLIIPTPNIFKVLRSSFNNVNWSEKIGPYIWYEHYNRLVKNTDSLKNYFKNLLPGQHILNEDVIGYKVLHVPLLNLQAIAQVLLTKNTVVVIPNTGNKMRCNKHKIISIQIKSGDFINEAFGPVYRNKYKINETYKINNLNTDPSILCGIGLYFYPTFDEAAKSEYCD